MSLACKGYTFAVGYGMFAIGFALAAFLAWRQR